MNRRCAQVGTWVLGSRATGWLAHIDTLADAAPSCGPTLSTWGLRIDRRNARTSCCRSARPSEWRRRRGETFASIDIPHTPLVPLTLLTRAQLERVGFCRRSEDKDRRAWTALNTRRCPRLLRHCWLCSLPSLPSQTQSCAPSSSSPPSQPSSPPPPPAQTLLPPPASRAAPSRPARSPLPRPRRRAGSASRGTSSTWTHARGRASRTVRLGTLAASVRSLASCPRFAGRLRSLTHWRGNAQRPRRARNARACLARRSRRATRTGQRAGALLRPRERRLHPPSEP